MSKQSIAKSLMLVVALTATTLGCRVPRDVIIAHDLGDGTTRVYPESPEQVQKIAVEVLKENGAERLDEAADHAIGSWGLQFSNWGNITGVWWRPVAGGTQVTVVQRRKLAFQAFTNLTERGFHEDFAEMLAQGRAHAGK